MKTLPIVIVIIILLVIVGGIFMFSRNSGSNPKSSPSADVKSTPGEVAENPNAKDENCKEYDFKAELGSLKVTVDATASVKVSRKVEACLGVDPGFPITQTARAGKSVEFPMIRPGPFKYEVTFNSGKKVSKDINIKSGINSVNVSVSE